MKIEIVNTVDGLHELIPDWTVLTGNVVEQNINYEPIPLISLLTNVEYRGWLVVCVYSNSTLAGLFPLQTVNRLPLPIEQYSTLFVNHFMSCVPLVHNDFKDDTLDAYWDWFSNGTRPRILYVLEHLPSSDLGNRMISSARNFASSVILSTTTSRAIACTNNIDFDSYIEMISSSKSRGKRRRKLRRLEKLGGFSVRFTVDSGEQSLERELQHLADVESSGWKREIGSAIALHPNLQLFLHDTAVYAASKDRFLIATGIVGEDAVASFYCLINDKRLLIYKIGFDENYKNYSVGENTLLKLIEYAMLSSSIDLVDSCASVDAEMYNRCLNERQDVVEYQIGSNHLISRVCLASVSKSRRLRTKLKDILPRLKAR